MKISIKKILLVSILPLLLQGCLSTTDKKKEVNINTANHSIQAKDEAFIQKLADLQQRNAINDAQQALANGDKRFIAKAGRGLNIPNISPATYSSVKERCGLRYENGFGDMLYGENHRRYYRAFIHYAEQYNATILAACR